MFDLSYDWEKLILQTRSIKMDTMDISKMYEKLAYRPNKCELLSKR